MDTFGKMIFHFLEQVNYKRVIAKRLKEKGKDAKKRMFPRYYEKYSSNQALFYNLITYSFFLKTFGDFSLIIDLFVKMENHFHH